MTDKLTICGKRTRISGFIILMDSVKKRNNEYIIA